MIIRKADFTDIDVLQLFGKELHLVEKEFEPGLKYSEDESRVRYLKQLNNPLALFLIVEDDTKKPLGYLYAHAEEADVHDQLECNLEVIYLIPESRGKGLSNQLIQSCIDWAKKNHITKIKTEIFAQNTASRKAFEKNGFDPYLLIYSLEI